MSPIKKLGKKSRQHLTQKALQTKSATCSPKEEVFGGITNYGIDLDYILGLDPYRQKLAIFYEYARHSQGLVELIRKLQSSKCPEASRNLDLEQQQIRAQLAKLPPSPWLSLFGDRFPEKPFKDVAHLAPLNYPGQPDLFGMPQIIVEHSNIAIWMSSIKDEPGWVLQKGSSLASSMRKAPKISVMKISIPWCYTNAELKQAMGKIIEDLRPYDCPEPPKAGRIGRGKTSIKPMIEQLVAYRAHLVGLPRSTVKNKDGKDLYTSERGWTKAIQMARIRIETMLLHPFFEIQKKKNKCELNPFDFSSLERMRKQAHSGSHEQDPT